MWSHIWWTPVDWSLEGCGRGDSDGRSTSVSSGRARMVSEGGHLMGSLKQRPQENEMKINTCL